MYAAALSGLPKLGTGAAGGVEQAAVRSSPSLQNRADLIGNSSRAAVRLTTG
jgi:hypothetical protein